MSTYRKLRLHAAFLLLVTLCIPATRAGAQWSGDPTTNTPVYQHSRGSRSPQLCSDGSGGTIISFEASRAAIGEHESGVYAQRLNAQGFRQWPDTGITIIPHSPNLHNQHRICSDGTGGAIVVWRTQLDGGDLNRRNIYAQRVDASGSLLWTASGVPVTTHGKAERFEICTDGSGGVIIVWRDTRHDDGDIFAQRVNAHGALQWAANGVPLCIAAGSQGVEAGTICSDGTGGVIVVWIDLPTNLPNIQKLDASGMPGWTVNGIEFSSFMGHKQAYQICSDGLGGAYVTWDMSLDGVTNGRDVYVQRIHSDGSLPWGNDGIVACAAQGGQGSPVLCPVDDGVIIAWEDWRSGAGYAMVDIYAQRLNPSGDIQWVQNGIAVCTAPQQQSALRILGVNGGAILSWQDLRTGITNQRDIYAQGIRNDGTVAWTMDGMPICTADGIKDDYSQMCPDLAGGSILGWRDFRNTGDPYGWGGTQREIYASKTPNLAPLTPPSAPGALMATILSPTRIQLDWQDNSDNESHFVIEMHQGSGNWAVRTNTWANAVRSVITDLKPATEHFFRIKAVNPAHESAWSNVASATTPEFPPPAGLAAMASSSDAVELVWEDHSANETGFVVEYMESGPLWTVSDTLGANVTTAEVTGLQPETTYRFRVKAVEGTVSSAYSNIADVTTLQFLPAPANLTATVLTASSARLDWEDRSDGETGFAIEQRQGEGAWRNVAVAAADATGHVVDGLEADTDYLFRVRAVGNKAASSWSNEAGASTRVPPSVPRELTAQALSHREIELNWQRGSTNEEGYEIERRHGGGDWALVHTAGRGVVTLRDENLEERTTYTYRIRAHNVIGSSAWSAEASATTPATPVPGTPFGVTATATGSYSIRLSWVAPSPQYQSGFEIQESETGDETDFVRVVPDAPASATSYVRTGREPGTTYYYRIRAFNAGGSSSWTSVVSATTRDEDLRLPAVPQDVTATALGSGAIRIDWQLPSPSNEDGIEIERSVTGDTGDFEPLVPTLPAGTLTHTDDGLQARTTYHYRLRSYNQHGASEYSAVVGATTTSADLSAALRSAIAGKEALFPDLEGMLDDGSASMQVLRDIFGDYPRGYDESAARMLIAGWLADLPSDQDAAAQSMRRYVLFEEALRDAYSAPHRSPPLPGAQDVARQTARPISVLVRDLCALGQSWAQQRVLRTHPYVDAAIEDMLRPVHDGVQTLLMLMGLNTDDDVLRFYAQILHDGEAPVALGAQALQSMNDYWQARILGRHYIAATQPLIGQFALRSGKLDAAGSEAEAEAQRDALLDRIDTETAGFAGSFAGYNAICTGLDAVYAITTAPVSDVPIFLRRMVQLRPRLVDGMTEGIAQAADPVTRALYLTASSAFADVTPLPVLLSAGGEAIFDATAGGVPPAPESPFFRLAATAQMHGSAIDAAEEDRNRLIALRSAVDAAQAEEIAREFDALRFGGRQMIGEIDRLLRPLFGVDPAGLYADAVLRDEYNRVVSRAQQYKSRRTVLSVSMAEYVLTQNHTHRQNLLAEIDTLLGTLPLTLSSIDGMTQRMSALIVRPVLLLDDAVLTADVAGGDNRFRLRLTVRNAGGSVAAGAEADVRLLAAGASVLGSGRYDFGAIPAGSQQSAVLDLEIPEGISVLPIAVVTRMTGGGSFVDERQLAVPHGTTGLEHPPTATSILYPNYPNPFTGSTNIRFSLAAEAAVRLSVHDLLGRELRTLVDARMPAGEHVYRFDAGGLPAGTYLCRLESLGRRSAAIMILYE